jgi:hypothetical protein
MQATSTFPPSTPWHLSDVSYAGYDPLLAFCLSLSLPILLQISLSIPLLSILRILSLALSSLSHSRLQSGHECRGNHDHSRWLQVPRLRVDLSHSSADCSPPRPANCEGSHLHLHPLRHAPNPLLSTRIFSLFLFKTVFHTIASRTSLSLQK